MRGDRLGGAPTNPVERPRGVARGRRVAFTELGVPPLRPGFRQLAPPCHRLPVATALGQPPGEGAPRASAAPVGPTGPPTYLMAAGAGVALGVVLQVVVGWAWWAVALGVLAVVWLIFMSTAFWGPRATGPGHDLLTELLQVTSPERAAARRERQEQELWSSPPLPLYGLPPAWEGARLIGGYGASAKAISNMELIHGDFEGKGPELRVEVTTEAAREYLPRFLAEDSGGRRRSLRAG